MARSERAQSVRISRRKGIQYLGSAAPHPVHHSQESREKRGGVVLTARGVNITFVLFVVLVRSRKMPWEHRVGKLVRVPESPVTEEQSSHKKEQDPLIDDHGC